MLTVHLLCARNCARLFPCISPLDPHNSRRCVVFIGLPRWWSGRESTCQCRRCKGHRFDPWVRKIPQRREWQPPPVFLPREFHGQRNLMGCSPRGLKGSDITEHACKHIHYLLSTLWLDEETKALDGQGTCPRSLAGMAELVKSNPRTDFEACPQSKGHLS